MLRLLPKRIFPFFLIFILCFSVFVYAKYVEPFGLTVTRLEFSSSKLTVEAEGLRIAVFADTHFGEHYKAENFRKTLAALKDEEPDIVIFLGDLLDHYARYAQTEDVTEISSLLWEIEAPLGKYAVYGNHDYGGGAEHTYPDIMNAGDFQVLVNEEVLFDSLGLQLIGIDDMLIGYGSPETAKKATSGLFDIVLAHEPDVADQILDCDFDLMLSGHTHGRQIDIPILDEYTLPPLGRKYIHGLYVLSTPQDAMLYVNAGIGLTKLPFRFGSAPELTLITLHQGSDAQ